jgi:hypothetical protein
MDDAARFVQLGGADSIPSEHVSQFLRDVRSVTLHDVCYRCLCLSGHWLATILGASFGVAQIGKPLMLYTPQHKTAVCAVTGSKASDINCTLIQCRQCRAEANRSKCCYVTPQKNLAKRAC